MRKLALILLCGMLCLLHGCTFHDDYPHTGGEYRVVTQIDVLYKQGSIVSQGSFSDPEKMQRILWYFRGISPYGTPTENPEQVSGSDFYVTLRYSDNTSKRYCQRDDRFMRVNDGPWKRIDPKRAVLLSRILGTLDSDDPNETAIPDFTPGV